MVSGDMVDGNGSEIEYKQNDYQQGHSSAGARCNIERKEAQGPKCRQFCITECSFPEALETKERVPVIWEHFQECTGCTESFIRSDHPLIADVLLDNISLDYTDTLMAASGEKAEEANLMTIELQEVNL